MNDNETEVWIELTALKQSVKSAHHRLDNIEKLVSSIQEIAAEIKYMRKDMAGLKSDVDELKQKPNKRYELIITAAVTAMASGVIGFFISKIFM